MAWAGAFAEHQLSQGSDESELLFESTVLFPVLGNGFILQGGVYGFFQHVR